MQSPNRAKNVVEGEPINHGANATVEHQEWMFCLETQCMHFGQRKISFNSILCQSFERWSKASVAWKCCILQHLFLLKRFPFLMLVDTLDQVSYFKNTCPQRFFNFKNPIYLTLVGFVLCHPLCIYFLRKVAILKMGPRRGFHILMHFRQ